MSFPDVDHVTFAVAEDMWQGFRVVITHAAGRTTVGPAGFILIGWDDVESCAVYKPPVAETHV